MLYEVITGLIQGPHDFLGYGMDDFFTPIHDREKIPGRKAGAGIQIDQKLTLCNRVISSYSIHYTKLYDPRKIIPTMAIESTRCSLAIHINLVLLVCLFSNYLDG